MDLKEALGATAHLTHIEDKLYSEGKSGGEKIFMYLEALFDELKGNTPKNKVRTTLKVDGCFSPGTMIETSQGPCSIFEVIQNYLHENTILVWTKNLETDQLELQPVEGGSAGPGNKRWVRITLEDTTEIFCTEDHPIHTLNRGYVEAVKLTPDDDIDYHKM